jgi:probable HAF family extracellular repeat protein
MPGSRRGGDAAVGTGGAMQAHAACDTAHPQLCDPTQMQVVDLGTVGTGASYANAVNTRGQVVGYFEGTGGSMHAFFYSAGSMTALGEPKRAIASSAVAINLRGHAVGWAEINTSGTGGRAMFWQKAKVVELVSANFLAINDSDVILGYLDGPTLWTNFVSAAIPGNIRPSTQ